MGFESRLFHSFQVSRGHISMLLFAATKAGNTVFSSEIFQSVTWIPDVEALTLNTVDLIIKTGIPCRMCFSLSPGWFLSLANTHFSLKRRWHTLLCLDVDVCSSLDHGWDCWDVVLSTLTLSPCRCFFVSLTFHIYTVKGNAFCLPASTPLNASCLSFPVVPLLGFACRTQMWLFSRTRARKSLFSGQWHLHLWVTEWPMKFFLRVKQLEWVQGAAQVSWLHGKLWRGASNLRAFLVCRAGTGRFWSVS